MLEREIEMIYKIVNRISSKILFSNYRVNNLKTGETTWVLVFGPTDDRKGLIGEKVIHLNTDKNYLIVINVQDINSFMYKVIVKAVAREEYYAKRQVFVLH